MNIRIVYASKKEQKIYMIKCKAGINVEQAILNSKILDDFKEIDLNKQKIGIFSEVVSLKTILKSNDRIEIYRELITNFQDARKLLAIKKKQSK